MGFEPTILFTGYLVSSEALSTTQPRLQKQYFPFAFPTLSHFFLFSIRAESCPIRYNSIIVIITAILNQAFPIIFEWVTHHGYPLIFLLMVAEGQVTTAAASFAASYGYFSLPVIFILAFFGDIVGDFLWYGVGYFGSTALIKKFGHAFGATPEKIDRLHRFFEKHPGKSLVVIKFSPILPVPGLIMVGSSRMSIRKFATRISAIIVPKTLLFMSLGYFFGKIFDLIYAYVKNGLYAVSAVIAIFWIIFYAYRKAGAKISEKIESES